VCSLSACRGRATGRRRHTTGDHRLLSVSLGGYGLVYSLRGLALIIYSLVRFRRLHSIDALIYVYIFMYALPFCFMGIMYCYSFTVVPLSAILLGWVLWELQGVGKLTDFYFMAMHKIDLILIIHDEKS
jgi:hypothetical protein